VAGQPVAAATFIFPDNPLVAGQTSSQVCVTPGTAGTVEPIFSNIAGQTTTDGTVVWSSLGSTPPSEAAQDWVQSARVALGVLLLPRPLSGVPDADAYLAPGSLNAPALGVPTAKYTILASTSGQPGDTMLQCVTAGVAGGSTLAQAVFQTFINPSGRSLFICVQAGTTGEFRLTFNETLGAQTTDGTAVWQCIVAGTVSVPVGGWPGMTPAASYFPTDRGQQSLQHMLCRARAKLRRRARAVQVSFQCRFEAAATISCRMNATITDRNLPGGRASGKVIAYKLTRDGDSGKTQAEVTIGCSIGKTGGVLGGGGGQPPPTGGTGYAISWAPATAYDTNQVVTNAGSSYIVTTPITSGSTFDPSATDPTTGVPIYQPLPPTVVDGTPVYVDGVFNVGEVEVWESSTVSVATTMSTPPTALARSGDPVSDIGYTPPVETVVDDGLSFPLHGVGDVILANQWHGVPATINPENIGDYNAQVQAAVSGAISGAAPPQTSGGYSISGGQTNAASLAAAMVQHINQAVYQGLSLWYELSLKNLIGGPYGEGYVVTATVLSLPKTIDLSAPSS
jgi:hypothetical protein